MLRAVGWFWLESSWNVMAHGDAREGKWKGNWRMEWVASTLHTTSEHGVSSITTADAHTSAASSWLNWHPCRFKWTRPFRRKTKYGFCACAITFQTQSISFGTACRSSSSRDRWANPKRRQTTTDIRRNVPEGWNPWLHLGRTLKSCKPIDFLLTVNAWLSFIL